MKTVSLNIICDNVNVTQPHINLSGVIVNRDYTNRVYNNIIPFPNIRWDVCTFCSWDELSQYINEFDTVVVIPGHGTVDITTTYYMSFLRFIRVNVGVNTDYNELKSLLSMWGINNINQVFVLMKHVVSE